MNPRTTNGGLDFFFSFGRLRHDCLISSVFLSFLVLFAFCFLVFFFVSLRSRVPHRLVRWTSDRASVRGAGLYLFG